MRIFFAGAARTVTGSQHLLEFDGTRLLLDCGLYQGRRRESNERNRNLPFDPRGVDAMVLSHAHIDHAGNIPTLVKHGFRGSITCTPATRDLCSVMLRDSARIQEADAEFLNRKYADQLDEPIVPLYTEADAVKALSHFRTLDYHQPMHGPARRHLHLSGRRPRAGIGHRPARHRPRAGPPAAGVQRGPGPPQHGHPARPGDPGAARRAPPGNHLRRPPALADVRHGGAVGGGREPDGAAQGEDPGAQLRPWSAPRSSCTRSTG